MKLNEKLRQIRLKAGMSQTQVAREVFLTTAAVCRYERGDRKIPLSYVLYWVDKGMFNLNDLPDYVPGGKRS